MSVDRDQPDLSAPLSFGRVVRWEDGKWVVENAGEVVRYASADAVVLNRVVNVADAEAIVSLVHRVREATRPRKPEPLVLSDGRELHATDDGSAVFVVHSRPLPSGGRRSGAGTTDEARKSWYFLTADGAPVLVWLDRVDAYRKAIEEGR